MKNLKTERKFDSDTDTKPPAQDSGDSTSFHAECSIPFDFQGLEDIRPALLRLRCRVSNRNDRDAIADNKHLDLLEALATRLKVTPQARENARRLATGHRPRRPGGAAPRAERRGRGRLVRQRWSLRPPRCDMWMARSAWRSMDSGVWRIRSCWILRPFRSGRIRLMQMEEARAAEDELRVRHGRK